MSNDARESIHRFLTLLFDPEDVLEVRAPKARQRPNASYTSTVSGYFTGASIDQAADEITLLDEAALAPGIYVTLNPVRADLLARAANRLTHRASVTTTDTEIVRRRWLLVDVDPVRPAGVSATDDELAAAITRAAGIRDYLASLDWPAPIEVESGNGAHLLYHIDLPRDDGGLVQRALVVLADQFDDDEVSVDRSVFNPARIVKIAGTTARKGDDLRDVAGVIDRPHRRSRVTRVPDTIDVVPTALLEALAAPTPTLAPRPSISIAKGERFPTTPDGVRAWLEARGVAVKGQRLNGTKTMLLLERCPVNPEIVSTGNSDIAVLVGDDGKLAYCNKHNRGQDFTWHDLRRAIDPDYDGPAHRTPGSTPGSTNDLGGVDLSQFMVGPVREGCVSSVSVSQPGDACLPDLRSVKQLTSEYPRLRPPVIHGLLREGETMNVIASPKTGKSWLVLDLAIAVATGRPWLGIYTTVPGEVLIIDNELHRETSAHRIPRVAEARGVRLSAIDEVIHIENLRGRLQDIHKLGPYFEALEPGRFKLIVLDAFYRFMPQGGDENDNATMANIYNRIDSFADRLRCCFVLIHHSTKGSQSSKAVTDVGAGAGSQSRATDTHLVLRPHEEDGVVVLDAAVRSWPPIEPVCLRWDFPVWHPAPELDPADLRNERSKKKRKDEPEQPVEPPWDVLRFVMTFITVEPRTRGEIRAAAKAEAGLSVRACDDLLATAEAKGLVHRWAFSRRRPLMFATQPQPEEES